MRKLLSVILSLVMVLSVLTPVFAEEAPKAPEAAPTAAPTMAKHIEFLKEQGIIQGDKTGNLMLDQNIDRASFAAILVRAAGKEATAESVKTLAPRFKDLTVAHWANGYATVALESNLMKGNPSGEFMPGKQISYAEIATTLVRFLNKEKAGFVYPTSYIAAATELGLFKDVEIGGAYTANATRDNVFKMLYNAVSKEDFGKYNVYKVMFLENDRVAQLGEYELNAEVLSVVQIANKVSERGTTAKIGQKFVLNVKDVKVEGGLADTENLIGKVADVTLDENNKLVKVVVDHKNYEYLYGGFDASKDGKTFEIAGRKFNVRFDERYFNNDFGEFPAFRTSERDDRVYRTYVTRTNRAENFNYMRFAERVNLPETDRDYINANFARVTVKDGMVLFVDAYCLSDIAPVKSGGGGVYYWNDDRDGAVERMTPADRVIGFTAKEGFRKIKAEDIKADDTIHWMDGFTLVRQDAKVEAELVKTYRNAWGEYVVLKNAEGKEIVKNLNSEISIRRPYRSVYAYDDQHYRRTRNRGDIDGMVGSQVKVLLDIREGVQLITSHNKFTDRLGLLNKVSSSNGTEFYASNKSDPAMYRLGDGWDSNYYKDGLWNAQRTRENNFVTTQEAKWATFSRLDLAYTTADKDEKAKVVAVIDGFEYNGDYFANPFGERDPQGSTWRTARFINARRDFVRVGGKDYRYTDDTEVWVINKDEDRFGKVSRVHVIPGVTMEDVKKYNKNNVDLQAAVLTEAAYAKFLKSIKVNSYGRYDETRDDFAKAIIFTNYEGPQTKYGKAEIGRVLRVDRWANIAEVEVNPGEVVEYIIDGGSLNMRGEVIKKFVEFRVAEGTEKPTARFDKIITGKAGTIERFDNHVIFNGIDKFNTDKITKEFGDSRTGYGWIYSNGGYADLIVYEEKGESEPALSFVEQLQVDAFVLKVNGLTSASSVQDFIDAIAMYSKLSDAAKKSDKAVEARKKLDKLSKIKLGTDYSEEYARVLARVKKVNGANAAEAKANVAADLAAAKALLKEFKQFKTAGMNLGETAPGVKVTYDGAAESTLDTAIKAVEKDNDDKKVANLTKDYNDHVTEVKRVTALKFVNLTSDIDAAKHTEAEFTNAKTANDNVKNFNKTVSKTTEDDVKAEIAELKAELQKLVNAYDAADGLARKNLK